MGILYSGSSIGGVVWPILMSRLLDDPNIGFKWSFRIAGFINVFPLFSYLDLLICTDRQIPIVVLINFTQKTRLPRRTPGPFLDFKFWKDPRFSLFEVGFFMVILGIPSNPRIS